MGYEWARHMHHLAYEIVNLPGNVIMSSRDGTVVLLDDLVREATQRAFEVVKEKNPELDDTTMQDVAQKVALGAIKYPMISRENTKIVTFDWDSALDFNGQSAPYIQYANVRANSILRKAGEVSGSAARFNYELEPSEVNLIELQVDGAIPVQLEAQGGRGPDGRTVLLEYQQGAVLIGVPLLHVVAVGAVELQASPSALVELVHFAPYAMIEALMHP